MSPNSYPATLVVVATIFLCALISAEPTIVALAHALGPLVLAIGLTIGVLRLVWHYTDRDR